MLSFAGLLPTTSTSKLFMLHWKFLMTNLRMKSDRVSNHSVGLGRPRDVPGSNLFALLVFGEGCFYLQISKQVFEEFANVCLESVVICVTYLIICKEV